MAESFTPPEAVASAARRGLRLREKVKAGTDVGVARARDLKNRRPVSLETIGRMVSFFARHGAQKPSNIGTDASPTPWLVAWLLWGGDAGRDWSASVWRRHGSEEKARSIGLARRGQCVALSREAPDPPPGVIQNPKALHIGRAFRTLTAGAPVRDGTNGEDLGAVPLDALRSMVAVFEARRSRGDGCPRIDFNHGPSRGGEIRLFGEVVGLYVADDGERGPGLYVVPGWTDAGRAYIAEHQTPSGDSLLSNSPEFMVGPVFARGGGEPGEQGDLLGDAELFAVALTPTPQQSESIIDPVRLSRGAMSQEAAPAAEEVQMDPEQTPDAGGMEQVLATLKEHGDLLARFGEALAALQGRQEQVESIAEDAEGAVEAAVAEGVEAIEEAVASAEAEAEALTADLSEDERAEMAAGEDDKDKAAMALSKATPAKLLALAKRAALAKAIKGRRSLSKQVAALAAESRAAKVEAERVALTAAGVKPAEVDAYCKRFARKLANPTAWATAMGDACPLKDERARLLSTAAARPGERLGVTVPMGQPAGPGDVREVIRAWAKANPDKAGTEYDKAPSAVAMLWSRHTGQTVEDFR